MAFPITRMRRLRRTESIRALVRETTLLPSNLVAPLFIVPGSGIKKEIGSMPGQFHFSADTAAEQAQRLSELGIPAVLLFAIPEHKDAVGSASWDPNGVVQVAIKKIRESAPKMTVITDLCFCEYTAHGHCGIIHDGDVDNDKTLEIMVKQTLSHAAAGAHMVAPSGMMDGSVRAMRHGLDESGFSDVSIMAYAAKFASGFYGPFRDAVQSTPEFGDRRTYQMDPANAREALREVMLDVEEGADIVMVKPAMAYLDIVRKVRDTVQVPVAAYNVSGEYSMVKAAAAKGWIDEKRVMLELLLSIKRAGADIIISYFAEDFAKHFKNGAV